MIARLLFVSVLSALGCAQGLAAGGGKASQPAFKIEAVQARLFYETTGQLSDNIASPAKFEGWNTMIGEGDAKEPANDLLVTVSLSASQKEANSETPLAVTLYGSKGQRLASRVFKGLFFKEGKVTKALLAANAACAGEGRIEAVFGREKRSETLRLNCGE